MGACNNFETTLTGRKTSRGLLLGGNRKVRVRVRDKRNNETEFRFPTDETLLYPGVYRLCRALIDRTPV